jgi:hypothetical protein
MPRHEAEQRERGPTWARSRVEREGGPTGGGRKKSPRLEGDSRKGVLPWELTDDSDIGKRHSFIGVFKFIDTDKYIQIISIGTETNEYKLIFIGFD